jgi:hypothetical protein
MVIEVTDSTVDPMADGRRYSGTLFDNDSPDINGETLEDITDNADKYATHSNRAAWWGYIWFENNLYHEIVKQNGAVVAHYASDDPFELLAKVNEVHGRK